MKYPILMAALILAAIHSFAEGNSGNGGDVVFCTENGVEKAQLLDVVEASEREIYLNLGPQDLSVRKKIEIYTSHLAKFSPIRAQYLQDKALVLLENIEKAEVNNTSELVRFTNQELTDVPDSHHFSLPEGCRIRQLIVRRIPQVKEDRLYTINRSLKKLIDSDNLVAMIFHELEYGDQADKGTFDSTKSRYLNSKIFSNELASMPTSEWFDILHYTEFDHYTEVSGFPLAKASVINGIISGNIDCYFLRGLTKDCPNIRQPVGFQEPVEMEGPISFYADGSLRTFTASNRWGSRLLIFKYENQVEWKGMGGRFAYYPNGEPQMIRARGEGYVLDKKIEYNSFLIGFYPNKRLAFHWPSDGNQVWTPEGQPLTSRVVEITPTPTPNENPFALERIAPRFNGLAFHEGWDSSFWIINKYYNRVGKVAVRGKALCQSMGFNEGVSLTRLKKMTPKKVATFREKLPVLVEWPYHDKAQLLNEILCFGDGWLLTSDE